MLSSKFNPASYRRLITYCTYLQCFYKEPLVKINTLSKYTKVKLSRNSLNAQLIYLQKVLGALASLKGVTSYLYNLNYIQKAVIYSCPSVILILQKAAVISSFVYQVAHLIMFKVSLVKGRGYLSFLVRVLRALQSTQNRNPPPSFRIKSTGKAARELLALINPFSSKSSSVRRRTRSLSQDIAQRGLYRTLGVFPSTLFNLIVQLTVRPQQGGSLFPSSRINKFAYSCRQVGNNYLTSYLVI